MTAVAPPTPRVLRLFAAVEPDAAARSGLHDVQRRWMQHVGGMDGLRLVPSASLHMTLRFFGDTPGAQVAPLVAGLRGLARVAQPCTATLQGIEYWPPVAPRVVVAAFDAPPALGALAAAIEQLAQDLGYPAERRAFHAHVTLARSHGTPLPTPACPQPALVLAVRDVALVRSRRQAAGARYEILERVPVGATASGYANGP